MSNMSYCRFHNTLADFEDCVEDIERRRCGEMEDERGDPIEPLSESETYKAQRLIAKALDLVRTVAEEREVEVDELSDQEIRKFITQLQADAIRTRDARQSYHDLLAEEDGE